jgi:hypothetical protein
MSARRHPHDWTSEWTLASGLALSSRTRVPDLLLDPRAARLLELALELVVLRQGLILHGYVVLPGALHVVGGRPARADGPDGRLPWPIAVGRAKGAFARWWNGLGARDGALWQEPTRVRPLGHQDVADAVARCHDAPVRAGLVACPADHPFSSWRRLYRDEEPGFVTPVPPPPPEATAYRPT